MSQDLLNELNAFRAIDGKDAFKDWRKARHMPMLEAYRADAGAVKAKQIDFEMSADERANQVGRESADIARDEEMLKDLPGVVLPIETKTVVKGVTKAMKPGIYPVKVVEQKVEGNVLTTVAEVITSPSYKEMTRHAKSQVEKPFNFIHSFLDENPTMKRKDAVAALVEKGVNFYTARTQYQRWFTNKKEAK